MQEDYNEEDCTIYIEELKSDDPNLKINAASKLSKIGSLLGPKRIGQELIPYLIEIIEEQDNEDEFLIRIAQEILNMRDIIQNQHELIPPLEILSSMEESAVRDQAVKCLAQLAADQDLNFFCQHFFAIVKQLGQWDNFPSRISSSVLIPITFENVTEDLQDELFKLYQTLCSDDTPMVRRSTAQHLPAMLNRNLNNAENYNKIIQLWRNLLNDQVDSVKVRAIESSEQIIKMIKKQDVQGCVNEMMQLIMQGEKSWRVRYAIPEILPSFINYLDQDTLQTKVKDIYEKLLNDNEQEVKSIALQQAHAILSYIPKCGQFLQSFTKMSTDSSVHVRVALAEQVGKLCKVFGRHDVESGLLGIVKQLLSDESMDVRTACMHSLPGFCSVLDAESCRQNIVPLLKQFPNDKQWRFRLEVMTVLPRILKVAGFETFLALQETIQQHGIFNHYHAIRTQALLNFVDYSQFFGYQAIQSFLNDALMSLTNSTNYLYRISALQGLPKLTSIIPSPQLQSYFTDICTKLLGDKIPNVRINCFKTYIELQQKLDIQTRNNFVNKSKNLLNDPDRDVQYYAENYQNIEPKKDLGQ